ncbi:hypothetical protein LCGC14_0376310 [marine sediment metagenome]|uniref:dATP/dGTP diphosphohydrolase N-terminal domain-containing protein n=1 Tax=marine sediment metagenome TaxID=412755 RepID=A0A0F9WCK6_9ZZZZ
MERKKVYELIDGERDYQDEKWLKFFGCPRPEIDCDHSAADWLGYIRYTAHKADETLYFLNKGDTLAHIRKIAALCVACMEHNETEPRKDSNGSTNNT